MLRSSLFRPRSRLSLRSPLMSPRSAPPTTSPESFNRTKEQRTLAKRLIRQRRLRGWIYDRLSRIRLTLIILSLISLSILPLSFPSSPIPLPTALGRSTYIDENALQPGQVTTYWGWGDVHSADGYLKGLEEVWYGDQVGKEERGGRGGRDRGTREGGDSEERATYLLTQLQALNIPATTQSYTWIYPSPNSRHSVPQRHGSYPSDSSTSSPSSSSSSSGPPSFLDSLRSTAESTSGLGRTTSSGTNVIATISPPRSSGTEIILLTVPWISLIRASDPGLARAPSRHSPLSPSTSSHGNATISDVQPNLRGVALALAFVKFLRGQNHWAKEIVIVFGDGDVSGRVGRRGGHGGGGGGEDGIAAWLAEWSGEGRDGLTSAALTSTPSGTIWTSFSIDYPGHSFSHLGIFHEGVNGALPNQDLINTVVQVGRSAGVGVEVRVGRESSDLIPLTSPSWFPAFAQSIISSESVSKYARGVRHLQTHFAQAALGKATGAHGGFAKYKIDGFTLFAEPSTGPHGFYAFGILLESSLRSCNNLLERLHASFFFYLMPFAGWFIPIGGYLPAAIMLAASVTIGGLGQWVEAGWERSPYKAGDGGLAHAWRRVDRRLDVVLPLVAAALFAGQAVLWAATSGFGAMFALPGASIAIPFDLVITWQLLARARKCCPAERDRHTICKTTSAITHILAGAGTSCIAMINFSQALLALAIFIPTLALAQPRLRSTSIWNRAIRFMVVIAATPENLTFLCRIGWTFETTTPWYGCPWDSFTAGVARDRVISGGNFLDGWLGFLWPVQLLAGMCILLGQ